VRNVSGDKPPTKSRYCGLKALVVCVGEIAVGLHADSVAREDVHKAVGKVDLSSDVVGVDEGCPDPANHRKSAAESTDDVVLAVEVVAVDDPVIEPELQPLSVEDCELPNLTLGFNGEAALGMLTSGYCLELALAF
jgi:hypothetical protein